jgi:hypothetical protein
VTTATPHDANTLSLVHTGPGLGTILRLVRRDDIPASARCPRVQACASDGRLVTWAQASAGHRLGTSGKHIGHAPLQWAVSEAATVFLRHHPDGQRLLARLEKNHGTGTALTILAHQLARAVDDRLKRKTAFDLALCLRA